MTYLAWKLLHIASVILFLGNIGTGLFWAAHAHRSRDFGLVSATFEGIIRSDRLFTMPGVIGIIVSGVAAAGRGDFPILGTGWILWPIILFSISGIVFGAWLAPLQRRIAESTRGAEYSEQAWSAYTGEYRKWERWGLVAFLAPVLAAVIMVLKPALLAF